MRPVAPFATLSASRTSADAVKSLERVHTEESAVVAVEIHEVETHFALPRRCDFDQPPAPSETVDGAAEYHAADQIEDDVRAFPSPVAARISAGGSSAPISVSAMARIGAL
jgi:hypothetical protein